MIPNTYHPALLFPNTLLNFNTLYRILISNTPSSNNDTHHYQSDNHQCCSVPTKYNAFISIVSAN